ncbi:MAG TPA: hypothetical protein VFO21_04590 [Vicinamibacterales bacterium]|nr:hypothetical protein [Vicinamibacterales bacterium]
MRDDVRQEQLRPAGGIELFREVGQLAALDLGERARRAAAAPAAPRPRPPNGTLISTPTFRSCANASTLSAALRFSIE